MCGDNNRCTLSVENLHLLTPKQNNDWHTNFYSLITREQVCSFIETPENVSASKIHL